MPSNNKTPNKSKESSSKSSSSNSKKSTVDKESNDSEMKSSLTSGMQESTSLKTNLGTADFSSTTYDTTDDTFEEVLTDPVIETIPILDEMPSLDRPSTIEFDTEILKDIPTSYEPVEMFDYNNNPIKELGFQEKIALPMDFNPDDVQIRVDIDGFTVFCDREQPADSEVLTTSYHQMKYTRMFDRPIKEVSMDVIEGKILVTGEFADFEYPQ